MIKTPSNDIEMKLGPEYLNLKYSGKRIPDAWSVIINFFITKTDYHTKGENRTKK